MPIRQIFTSPQKETTSRARYKHGYALIGDPVYRAWLSMRSRCHNPKVAGYPNYGGRGIKVDVLWNDFRVFDADMRTTWRKNLSLHRIDNDGAYTKANCMWADRRIQNSHTTRTVWIELNGQRKSLYEWSATFGLPHKAVRHRWQRGWGVPKLFKPLRTPRGHA